MDHVVTRPPPPFAIAGGALEVHVLPAWRDNLVWGIAHRGRGEAAIVDGPDADATLRWLDAEGLRLTAVLVTHTHGDHVGVLHDLGRRGLRDGVRVVGPRAAAADVPGLTEPVDEGDTVTFGGVPFAVMRTDGHLDGHVSYAVDGAVFCGDTLFAGGCGYLFDGPPAAMFRSLMRLAALPPDTRVCCAHEYTEDNLRFAWTVEPDNAALADRIRAVRAVRASGGCTVPSTIAEERATNPFLRPGSPTLVAAVRAALPDAPLDTDAAVFAATRRLKDLGLHKALPDDALPR